MKTHKCDAIANSYCVNVKTILPTDTGYTCECQSGFRKVGKSCIHEGQRIIFQLDINYFLSWSIFKLVRLFNIRDVLLEDGVEGIFEHVCNYARESTEKKNCWFLNRD